MNRRLLKHSFSLLHIDYAKLDTHWNYDNVLSPYYRIYLIDEGEGYINGQGKKLILRPGHFYIIPSFTVCNMKCPAYLSQYFIHFFEDSPSGISLFHNNRTLIQVKASDTDIANVKRLLQINPGRGINRSDNPKVYEKNIFYKEYEELNNSQNMANYLETQGILLQLIARFVDSNQFENKTPMAIPSKILEAISFIQLNLRDPLTVAQLAQRANQHPDYFSRQFANYTGERPLAYIHQKRIERAQYLITTTPMPYTEIADATGFESLPYFSKVFKKLTGITPDQYRKAQRSTNA